MKTPSPQRRNLKQKRGFTFLEVMIAMLIVSLGMLGSMGLSSYVLRSCQWSERLATGNMAGQDKLEELRDSNFFTLASGSDTNGIFQRSWRVQDFADGKEISLRVYWESVDGIGHATQMRAFLSDPRNSNGNFVMTQGLGDDSDISGTNTTPVVEIDPTYLEATR